MIGIDTRETSERATEELYRTIFENTGSGTIIIEDSMVISLVNSEFCRLTGYGKTEIENRMHLTDFLPDYEREKLTRYHHLRRASPDATPRRYEAHILNRAGETRSVMAAADLIPGTRRSVVSFIDVTEQKGAQEDLRRSVRQLTILSRTTQRINAVLEIPAVMRALVSSALELSGSEGGTVGLLEGGKMVFREYNRAGTIRPIDYAFEPGVGVPGWVLQNARPYRTNDAAHDPWLLPGVRETFGIRTLANVPILDRQEKMIGCIEVHNKKDRAQFDDLDILMLEGLAASASVALENARFVQDLRTTRDQLAKSYELQKKTTDAIIETMLKIVEVRDPYTAGHERHTADLAAAIAREMGLSDSEVSAVRMGAITHDIGKMYVPSEILSKPGPLTPLEYNIIKIHPMAGYDILKIIDFPWPVAEIVREHHERYDGSGYPRGLKGDEILLEARILMVADVIDSIALHRPYRPRIGLDVALNEIRHNRGTLYDPRVVDATLRLFEEKKFEY